MGGWCSCLDDDQEGKSAVSAAAAAAATSPALEAKTQLKTTVAQVPQQQQQPQTQQPQQQQQQIKLKANLGNHLSTSENIKSIGKVGNGGVLAESKLSHGAGGGAASNTGGGSLIATVATTTKYGFNNHIANGLDQAKDGDEVAKRLMVNGGGHGRLARDQKLKKTLVAGLEVNSGVTRLMTRKEVERQRHMPDLRADISLILEERFSSLHLIVPGIYLTSTFGLQSEPFAEAKVWVLVNATYELPAMRRSELLCYRVPVEDDTASRIDVYFDDVADLLETARRRGRGAVVHCVAGVSRSTTLVLAYLLKYTDMNLRTAFCHTKTIRPVVRPNMAFMKQLSDYEAKVKPGGQRSMSMVTVTDRRHKVTVTVPDFYKKEFPDLYEWEVNKQLAKNASNGGGDGKK